MYYTQTELLELIKEMIDEDTSAMKLTGSVTDYLDGRSCALKELCERLGIATWESLSE